MKCIRIIDNKKCECHKINAHSKDTPTIYGVTMETGLQICCDGDMNVRSSLISLL